VIDVLIAWMVSAAGLMGLWQIAEKTDALNQESRERLHMSVRFIDFEGRFRSHVLSAQTLPKEGQVCGASQPAWLSDWCATLAVVSADSGFQPVTCLYRESVEWELVLMAPSTECQRNTSNSLLLRRWQF